MFLETITAKRRIQLAREKQQIPPEDARRAAEKAPPARGFAFALKRGRPAVIAEVKKASPSKGLICPDFHPAEIARSYQRAGADAVSVLTEEAYFGGSREVLRQVRAAADLPLLRKDFIFDPYQIYEARAFGADAVLLIAAMLPEKELRALRELAESLGMDCLMEAHNRDELESVLAAGATLIGINNRDLATFRVDLGVTRRLAKLVPPECVLVSESGVSRPEDVAEAVNSGAQAVLIGEALMRSADPAAALRELRGAG